MTGQPSRAVTLAVSWVMVQLKRGELPYRAIYTGRLITAAAERYKCCKSSVRRGLRDAGVAPLRPGRPKSTTKGPR